MSESIFSGRQEKYIYVSQYFEKLVFAENNRWILILSVGVQEFSAHLSQAYTHFPPTSRLLHTLSRYNR